MANCEDWFEPRWAVEAPSPCLSYLLLFVEVDDPDWVELHCLPRKEWLLSLL